MNSELHYPEQLRDKEAEMVAHRRCTNKNGQGTEQTQNPEAIRIGQDDRVGVALSGGGIRSATFCLGVFQALADEKLLRRIDYLSTVSGGGYFGSFLGRLFTRPWIDSKTEPMPPSEEHLRGYATAAERVEDILRRRRSWCMRYLRNSGRYLSPTRTGDFWLAIAAFLRNWVSMLVVLWVSAFALLSLLTTVRAATWSLPFIHDAELWLAQQTTHHFWWSPWIALPLLVVALVALPVSFAYWMTLDTWTKAPGPLGWLLRHLSRVTPVLVLGFALFSVVRAPTALLKGYAGAVAVTLFLAFWLWSAAKEASGAENADEHPYYGVRNRLSRWLAGSLKFALLLLVLAFVDALAQSTYALAEHLETLSKTRGVVTLAAGVVGTTGVALFAQRFAALLQKLPDTRKVQIPATVLATVAGATLAVAIAGSASFAAYAVAWRGEEPVIAIDDASVFLPGAALASQSDAEEDDDSRVEPVQDRDGLYKASKPDVQAMCVACLISIVLSFLFGRTLGFFNLSSLHSFYSARLARAYLGASNAERFEDEGQLIGKPMPGDDVWWADYAPWKFGGPLHLINQTLNETISGRTQIEYRDRKGLILAHGPAGLSVGRDDHGIWDCEAETASEAGQPDWAVVKPIGTRAEAFHALGLPRININSPDIDLLKERLERELGRGTARAIYEERKGGARFTKVEQLLDVKGISKARYKRLVPRVTLDDDEPFGRSTGVERCRLGRLVAISGAAFTTGLGMRTHLGTSLLAALLNVRLGYWWSIDLTRAEREKAKASTPWKWDGWLTVLGLLFPVQAQLISEASARFFGPSSRRWYLSDGGHFENTGAYELLRRRIPFIVVCDCGQDRDYRFSDLSGLARKIRIDFGSELEVLDVDALGKLRICNDARETLASPEDFAVSVGNGENGPARTKAHAVLAKVIHPTEDGVMDSSKAAQSWVLFLKPSVTGDEPPDVLNYQSSKTDFPNESTLDQYFDEAQWESYRRLGVHIAQKLFEDRPKQHSDDDNAWQPRDMFYGRSPRPVDS